MVSASLHTFQEFSFTTIPNNILQSHWLLSPSTTIETMVSYKRGIIPVAMNVIKSWKAIGQAGNQTNHPQFSSPVRYRLSFMPSALQWRAISEDEFNLAEMYYYSCSSLENIVEMEQMIVTSIFNFSHNAFNSPLNSLPHNPDF